MSSDSETNEALSFAESSDGSEVLRKIGGLLRAKYDHTVKDRSRTFLRMKVVIQMIIKKKETSMF